MQKISAVSEFVKGQAYRMLVNYDGNLVGDIVIFSHPSTDNKGKPVGVFHPNGESDMQSMFMAYPHEVGHA